MTALVDETRHEPLGDVTWHPGRAREAIAAICRDAEAAFDPARLWPLHPDDAHPLDPPDGILRGLYGGAAGMLHGLDRLAAAGVHAPSLDAAAIAADLHAPSLRSPDQAGAGASLLVGATGILLVAGRLAPSPATDDLLAEAIAANVESPANELLLGAPGTMLAARAAHGRGGEERFAALWRSSARTLLARQEPDGLWTQPIYGSRRRYVGAGHGFAGNVDALLGAPEWLDDAAGVAARAVAAATALARHEDGLVNWGGVADGTGTGGAPRTQWCHGAPGMLIALGRLAPADEAWGALLDAAGELVWHAGPLARGAGLCHGTAGNGFAFLALLARTGDERWLARARAFAMHALRQVERFGAARGRGRYSLFTGDLGAALLAAACLDGADARFPGIADL